MSDLKKNDLQLSATVSTERDQRPSVTFGADVEEASPISSTAARQAQFRSNLTQSGAAWDVDGDGQLDETELALKNLDRSRKGFLNKDQMYELMSDNLQTQRELFKVKKVVAGLVCFTCLLAISNLGTSLAAAFLAKDTKSEDDALMSTKTGNVLRTQTASDEFVIDPVLHERMRKLLCESTGTTGTGRDRVDNIDCAVDEAWSAVDHETGKAIVAQCQSGNTVRIVKAFSNGASKHHDVCHPGASPSFQTYDLPDPLPEGIQAHKAEPLTGMTISSLGIEVQPRDSDDILGSLYSIRGLLSEFDDPCDASADCIVDHECRDNLCTNVGVIATTPATVDPRPTGATTTPRDGSARSGSLALGATCTNDADCETGSCGVGMTCRCADDSHCLGQYDVCTDQGFGGWQCTCDVNNRLSCPDGEVCKKPCAIDDVPESCTDAAEQRVMDTDCNQGFLPNFSLMGRCAVSPTNSSEAYCP